MSRYTVTGLCITVALLVGAFAAASAVAAEGPEFGHCAPKASHEGAGYKDHKCVRGVSSGAKFEWVPGAGSKPGFTWIERFAFSRKHRQCSLALSEERLAAEDREEAEKVGEPEKAKLLRAAEEHEAAAEEHYERANLSKAQCESLLKTEEPKAPVLIEIAGLKKVICGGLSGSGEYTGPKSVGNVKFSLTECELVNVPFECTSSGASEGEIVTSTLDGSLGVIEKGEVGVKAIDGIDYSAVSGPIAEFTCGPYRVTMTGSVIRPVRTDKSERVDKFKFKQSKGHQVPEEFEGMPVDVLESSVNGGPSAQTGLTLRGVQTNQEMVEVNSVI